MTEKLPLSSQNILLTRPAHQSDELKQLFEEQGATVFLQPTIAILPPSDWQCVDAAIKSIFSYDILIFPSSNSVRFFFERVRVVLPEILEKSTPPFPQVVATGPGTAATLAHDGVKEVHIPSESYDAEGMIALLTRQKLAKKRVLLVRGNRGRTLLVDELTRRGASIEQITVYQSVDFAVPTPEIASLIQCGRIHWVTVTSSAIGRSLVRMFSEDLRHTKLASISPITSQTMTECGFPPAVEATEATLVALVAAIIGEEIGNRK